jgi:hypothetical protein
MVLFIYLEKKVDRDKPPFVRASVMRTALAGIQLSVQ